MIQKLIKLFSGYKQKTHEEEFNQILREEILIDILGILDNWFKWSGNEYIVRNEFDSLGEWVELDDQILARELGKEFEIAVTYDDVVKHHTLKSLIDLILEKENGK